MTEMPVDAGAPRRPAPWLERLTDLISIVGGMLSLAVAALVVVSVLGRWFRNAPVQGDFEIVKMATAVSAFCFLPYCQLRRGNIMVDTFTMKLPAMQRRAIDGLWDCVYTAMTAFMAYCLMLGAAEAVASGETTMMLQLILWPSIVIAAALMVLLALVSLASTLRMFGGRT